MKVNHIFHFIIACCFIPGLTNASAIRGVQYDEDTDAYLSSTAYAGVQPNVALTKKGDRATQSSTIFGGGKGGGAERAIDQIGTLGNDKIFPEVADVSNFRRRVTYTGGLGACAGTNNCNDIGLNGNAIVGDYSCADTTNAYSEMCKEAGGTNGDFEAGNKSCVDGNNACNKSGYWSGHSLIGHKSCSGFQACLKTGFAGHFIAGDNSCIGHQVCYHSAAFYGGKASIGNGSCVGRGACHRVGEKNRAGVIVGDKSCNGVHSCTLVGSNGKVEIVVGIGSCNCDNCCKCLNDGDVVPDDTCNALGDGPEHCCSSASTRSSGFDFSNTRGAPVNGKCTTKRTNVALFTEGGRATQSSTDHGGSASRAIDGNTNGVWKKHSITHTRRSPGTLNPHWEVQLDDLYFISQINVYNRKDCCNNRIENFVLTIYDNGTVSYTSTISDPKESNAVKDLYTFYFTGIKGDKVRIDLPGANRILSLAEVEVLACEVPKALTKSPTKAPTKSPTKVPTKFPTKVPTKFPTKAPTKFPTKAPTKSPTKAPTKFPTKSPTKSPIKVPTTSPTKAGLKIVSGKVYEIRNMYKGKPENESYLRETNKVYGHNKFYTSVGPERHHDGCSLWKLTAHGDDIFTIRNMWTGKTENQSYLRETLQAYGSSGNKFYTSVGPESNGEGCSLWKITAHGDDAFTIRNMYSGNNIPKTKNQSYLRETSKVYGTNKFYTSVGPESNESGCSLWSIKPYPN